MSFLLLVSSFFSLGDFSFTGLSFFIFISACWCVLDSLLRKFLVLCPAVSSVEFFEYSASLSLGDSFT